jgi:hypothetical protein
VLSVTVTSALTKNRAKELPNDCDPFCKTARNVYGAGIRRRTSVMKVTGCRLDDGIRFPAGKISSFDAMFRSTRGFNSTS